MRRDDKVFLTVWITWGLICLAILGTVIFVVAHFVGKYW